MPKSWLLSVWLLIPIKVVSGHLFRAHFSGPQSRVDLGFKERKEKGLGEQTHELTELLDLLLCCFRGLQAAL